MKGQTVAEIAAIANAIHHAIGIRVTSTAMTPVKLVPLLAERRKEG
jgi:CO/xanthine dehydrogenase Mo-binding subunit